MGLWRSQVAHRTLNPAVVGSNPSRPALHESGVSVPPHSSKAQKTTNRDSESNSCYTKQMDNKYQNKNPKLSLEDLDVYLSHDFLQNFHSRIKSKETDDAYTKNISRVSQKGRWTRYDV